MADTNGNGRSATTVLPMNAPEGRCPVCLGSGQLPGFSSDPRSSILDGTDKCAVCNGSGTV